MIFKPACALPSTIIAYSGTFGKSIAIVSPALSFKLFLKNLAKIKLFEWTS